MERGLREFNAGFLRCFQRVNDVNARLRHIAPLPLSLSTITFTGTLSVRKLPVDEMRLAVEIAEDLDQPFEFQLDCDTVKRHKHKRQCAEDNSNKRFRYQLPLKRHGKSVKLFHNGSVQATGCKSPLEFLEMMQALAAFVADAGGVRAWLVDFDIRLINTLFLLSDPATGRPLTVAPGALLRRVPDRLRADFDTERHPSVKITLVTDDGAKGATVCVFQTGSVSIMGARRPANVAAAYEMVCDLLHGAAEEVCRPDAPALRTTTAKQGLVLAEGYPFNLYACCQKV